MLTYAERLAKFLFESNRQQSASRAHAGEGSAERQPASCVSIRQHTPAYVSAGEGSAELSAVSIRQHTPACVSIRQHTPAYVSAELSTADLGPRVSSSVSDSAYVRMRQHTAGMSAPPYQSGPCVSSSVSASISACTCTASTGSEEGVTYADACGRMLTYADACTASTGSEEGVTHADACGRMLTYADVCTASTGSEESAQVVVTHADACGRMLTHAEVAQVARRPPQALVRQGRSPHAHAAQVARSLFRPRTLAAQGLAH